MTQASLKSFFKVGTTTPQNQPSQSTLSPEQRERIERNRQEAIQRQKLLGGAAATPQTPVTDVSADPPEKRQRSESGAVGRPAAQAPTARAAQPPPVQAKKFVPAPINHAGLTAVDIRSTIQKQRAKDKKDLRFEWLADPRDLAGKRPGEEGYDPRHLYIDPNALAQMSEFEKQYWMIKKDNWDTVIFFKKGKFYELYEIDADIGHRHFNLRITPRVNMRMVGVPESAFNTWAKQFIYKGFKVGRVEQMESKVLKSKAGDRGIVNRELCQIITLGTLVEEDMLADYNPNFLLAVKEDSASTAYGICFIDASRGMFFIARLTDTAQRAEFSTLLHRTKPKELVVERNNISKSSQQVLTRELPDASTTRLNAGTEFLDASTTRSLLRTTYFPEAWPEVLKRYEEDDLVLSALGGCIWYLKTLKLDEELLSMGDFTEYSNAVDPSQYMVLDGIALANLEVLENSRDKGPEGTLLQYLNRCITPFGRRQFKKWVCNPLKSVPSINSRLDAVEDLVANPEMRAAIEGLRGITDVERNVSRVFAGGRENAKQAFYIDAEVFSKRQVNLLTNTVNGFRKMVTAISTLGQFVQGCQSQYLRSLCTVALSDNSGQFPDVDPLLTHFETSFDVAKAKETGFITPHPGKNHAYDAAVKEEREIERALDDVLTKQRKIFKDDKIVFRSIGKETFQLEISKSTLQKKRPSSDYSKMSETSKVERYWTPELRKLAENLKVAQLRKEEVLRDVLRVIMNDFGKRMSEWKQCISVIADLDCLYSLASVSSGEGMCRPVVDPSPEWPEAPYLQLRGLRHPCVKPAVGSKARSVVPNDVTLGSGVPNCLLVTGPNMGGKSTIMRSVSIACIMAQMGAYVCAEECRLSIVDRIFTRIGASDRIMSGESTFMVELEETSNILHHSTKDSLVILDELGRGTSTFDGYAIAYSTLKYIAENINCRTLFSTHYYFLAEEMARECADVIDTYHMHFSVEPTGEVTFLYTFQKGVCQKSYGIDVARKAGLPAHVLQLAQKKSEEFEEHSCLREYSQEKQRAALLIRLHEALKENPRDMAKIQELQEVIRSELQRLQ